MTQPNMVERLRRTADLVSQATGEGNCKWIRNAADRIEELEGQLASARKALEEVRAIISEAALTGFNCKDGDWAERLFASQATTSAAIKDIST